MYEGKPNENVSFLYDDNSKFNVNEKWEFIDFYVKSKYERIFYLPQIILSSMSTIQINMIESSTSLNLTSV